MPDPSISGSSSSRTSSAQSSRSNSERSSGNSSSDYSGVDTSSLSGIEAASRQQSTGEKLSSANTQVSNLTGDKEERSPAGAIAAAATQDSAHRSPGPITSQAHIPGRVEAQGFRTPDAAAFNALEKSNPTSIRNNVEVGGYIYENPETKRFHATEPVLGTADELQLGHIKTPDGARTVGDYHTHADYSNFDAKTGDIIRTTNPANDGFNSDRFSVVDFQGNSYDGTTGYLATPSGEFRSVQPDVIPDGVFSDPNFDPDTVRDSRMSIPLETARTSGRNGAIIGGGVELGVATYNALGDGYQHSDLGTIANAGARGAAAGGATAIGEHYVERGIERTVGSSIQRRVGEVAARNGLDDVAVGTAARTIASRAGGAGAVGAVVGAGFSIYDNREGLARGDSEAIGDVAGDTVVAAGSALAGAAAGAAIGSAVPVLGTAVGAVVGLGVGLGVDYIARKGGVDEVVGDVVSGGVDQLTLSVMQQAQLSMQPKKQERRSPASLDGKLTALGCTNKHVL